MSYLQILKLNVGLDKMQGVPNAHSEPHQMQSQCTSDSDGTIGNFDSPSSTVTTKNPHEEVNRRASHCSSHRE